MSDFNNTPGIPALTFVLTDTSIQGSKSEDPALSFVPTTTAFHGSRTEVLKIRLCRLCLHLMHFMGQWRALRSNEIRRRQNSRASHRIPTTRRRIAPPRYTACRAFQRWNWKSNLLCSIHKIQPPYTVAPLASVSARRRLLHSPTVGRASGLRDELRYILHRRQPRQSLLQPLLLPQHFPRHQICQPLQQPKWHKSPQIPRARSREEYVAASSFLLYLLLIFTWGGAGGRRVGYPRHPSKLSQRRLLPWVKPKVNWVQNKTWEDGIKRLTMKPYPLRLPYQHPLVHRATSKNRVSGTSWP